MTRAIGAPASRRKKKKRLKLARGFFGSRSRQICQATETLNRAMAYSWRDRKAKKRDFRQLWIARINAAVRSQGLSYSVFIKALKKAKIDLDRKILAQLALDHQGIFNELVTTAKENLK